MWIYSIDQIYKLKSDKVDCKKDISEELQNFSVFLLARIQEFMLKMAEYVRLEKIINLLDDKNKGQQNMTYSEFHPTFEEKVKRETYLENIMQISKDLLLKDTMADTNIVHSLRINGCASRTNLCDKCKRNIRLDKQSVHMFKCGHNFHSMCLKDGPQFSKDPKQPGENKKNCLLCFNQNEHICKSF